jgi:UDPglucose 6-dehydrogenase
MATARPVLGEERVTWCTDAYDAAQGADLLVFFTEWNEFRKLDLERLKRLLAAPRVVDCRNMYDPRQMREAGFEYLCVGR